MPICANYIQLREALGKNQEYIGAMSDDELRRAIENLPSAAGGNSKTGWLICSCTMLGMNPVHCHCFRMRLWKPGKDGVVAQ